MEPLGLIAGGGTLPQHIIDACVRKGRRVIVAGLKGYATLSFSNKVDGRYFRLGSIGAILGFFKKNNVKDIVFAGSVARPGLLDIMPDAKGVKVLKYLGGLRHGDDSLLKKIAMYLEQEEGFRVLDPRVFLEEEGGIGSWGAQLPTQGAHQDIEKGQRILQNLSSLDIGQSVVVQQGLVLGIEAIEGTDALITRCGQLKRSGLGPVLIKMPKVGQDERLDFPTIGLNTIELLFHAGFSGLAFGASIIVLDSDAVVKRADTHKLFLYGLAQNVGSEHATGKDT